MKKIECLILFSLLALCGCRSVLFDDGGCTVTQRLRLGYHDIPLEIGDGGAPYKVNFDPGEVWCKLGFDCEKESSFSFNLGNDVTVGFSDCVLTIREKGEVKEYKVSEGYLSLKLIPDKERKKIPLAMLWFFGDGRDGRSRCPVNEAFAWIRHTSEGPFVLTVTSAKNTSLFIDSNWYWY